MKLKKVSALQPEFPRKFANGMVLLHSTVLRPWWKEETIFFLLCNNLKSFFSTFEHDNINDIIRVSTNKIWPD